MPLGDAYQESTDRTLAVMASAPLEIEKPKPKHSAWSTVPRAVAGAFTETAGNLLDTASAFGQVAAAAGGVTPGFDPDARKNRPQAAEAMDKLKTEGIDWRPDVSRPQYEFARDMRPDPLTAGVAENIVFGVTKGLTKAIGAGTVLGPVGGALAFGASEGMTTAEDLADQGVDKTTRTQVGAVTAALNTAGMALPVAGKTIAGTVGLAITGGPASFIAQQQATRSILEAADYGEIAQQFDPLDPVGLAVSTLLPLGFGAWAMRGRVTPMQTQTVKTEAGTMTVKTDAEIPASAPQEQIDAAMVQNLTIARDAYEEVAAKIQYIDPRLENSEIRTWFDGMRNETGWAEEGGRVLRDGEDGEVIGRTKWIPNFEWWAARPDGLSESATVTAIDKALAGEKLKAAEERMVRFLVDVAEERARSTAYWPDPEDLEIHGLQGEDSMAVAMVARASELDPDGVERLAIQFENDDAGFMRGIQELLSGKDQDPQIARSREGDTRAQGQGTEGTEGDARNVEAYVARVEALRATAPDMPVALREDGTPATVAEELDAIRRQVQEGTDTELGAMDADLLRVAAECALTVGA